MKPSPTHEEFVALWRTHPVTQDVAQQLVDQRKAAVTRLIDDGCVSADPVVRATASRIRFLNELIEQFVESV